MGQALGGDVPMLPCTSVVTSPGRNSRARGIPYRIPHKVDGKPIRSFANRILKNEETIYD